ncbi:MAG: hypothetical protein QM731_11245 [Chitinophagaceae bacterium]
MREFKLDPERISEPKKIIIRRSVISAVFTLLLFCGVYFFSLGDLSAIKDNLYILIAPIIVILLVGYSTRNNVQRQQVLYETYLLTVTDTLLTREQKGVPDVDMYTKDITAITKSKDGSYFIKGLKANDLLYIPRYVENRELLEQELGKIQPITPAAPGKVKQWTRFALSLILIASMVTVYMSDNRLLVAISAVLSLVAMGWSFYSIQRNQNIEKRTKRGAYWMIVVAASIIYLAITKVF